MINWTLYKRGIRGSLVMLLILAAVITMYFTVIISMFDPALGSALNEFAKTMPELMAAVGMVPASAELVSFLSAYLYGFIMPVFPMLFCILSANKLIARHVDRGSMTYLLAAPVKRATVALTQLIVMVTGLCVLVIYATVLGIVSCQIPFPGELDIGKFILLNIGLLCLQLFIGGICFICACIFNDSKYAVGTGAGIPALGFIIQMMANAGKELENAKYATFFTLFDSDGIIAGESDALIKIFILFTGAIVLFLAAITIFSKKDLQI